MHRVPNTHATHEIGGNRPHLAMRAGDAVSKLHLNVEQ